MPTKIYGFFQTTLPKEHSRQVKAKKTSIQNEKGLPQIGYPPSQNDKS
jgi:hypothetical protein